MAPFRLAAEHRAIDGESADGGTKKVPIDSPSPECYNEVEIGILRIIHVRGE